MSTAIETRSHDERHELHDFTLTLRLTFGGKRFGARDVLDRLDDDDYPPALAPLAGATPAVNARRLGRLLATLSERDDLPGTLRLVPVPGRREHSWVVRPATSQSAEGLSAAA